MVARWSLAVLCCLSFGTACTRTAIDPSPPRPLPAAAPPTTPAASEPACDASLTKIRYMMRRVKSRPDGAPLLPYARFTLDADDEQQLAAVITRLEAHPSWHIEVAVHLDPATRAEAAPEVADERLRELASDLHWPLRVVTPPDRVAYVVHGAPDGPPEDPRAGAWIDIIRRCGPFPPDQDHDAVPDPADRCIDVPEDLDLHEDADGCPDRDNDGDGVLDAHTWTGTRWTNCDGLVEHGVERDCRDLPEDFDGMWDEDGCPDVITVEGRPAIVTFTYDPKNRRLAPATLAALDAVVAHAAANPSERYWVDIHTGHYRDPKRALAISEHLTLHVLAELVRRGVALARLEGRPFGAAVPIADDRTPAGHKANHRIEIYPKSFPDAPPRLCTDPTLPPAPNPPSDQNSDDSPRAVDPP